MRIRGKVKNGKVVLDDPKALANGAEVEVRLVGKDRKATKRTAKKNGRAPLSAAKRYAKFIGCIKDLPADMSVNHDHYLYGHAKQE